MAKENLQWELDQLLKLKEEIKKTESDRKDMYDNRIQQLKDLLKAAQKVK